ncbi:MAG TPA: SRPBCC domain-containing protein [Flavisolibacter sp.]
MKRLHFSIDIEAPRNKVWSVLWNDDTYRKWTSAFYEGSYAVSSWNEGDKVLFLGPGGDGMVATISRKSVPEQMAFTHQAMAKGGVEQPADEETKKWAGAQEIYTLTENGAATLLTVDIDVSEDFEAYFEKTFPIALEKVRTLAEEKVAV